jgi:sugar transferase (PEP-CTERM system associated)
VPSINLPPRMAATALLITLVILLAVRFGFIHFVDENIFRRQTLVFGAGDRAAEISKLRRKADRRGFKLVGRIAAPGDANVGDNDKLIPHDKALVEIARETGAEEIVIAMDERRGNLPIRELLDCKLRGIDVMELVDFLERETGTIRIDVVNPGWLIFTPGFRVSQIRKSTKRLMDVILSLMIFILGWPILLLVAASIKLTEGRSASIIYRQKRVGLHGDVFDVLKFRSMREDAEQDGQAVWAEEDDDRITSVGRVIRKVRLDELPQVFNVLRGEMSLVGPRPERPEFVEKLAESIPYYIERHSVKPGVTGWAQLRYAYGSSEEDAARKLQFDLYYVKNQGFMLDLVILLQTVEVVLWGKGAR